MLTFRQHLSPAKESWRLYVFNVSNFLEITIFEAYKLQALGQQHVKCPWTYLWEQNEICYVQYNGMQKVDVHILLLITGNVQDITNNTSKVTDSTSWVFLAKPCP